MQPKDIIDRVLEASKRKHPKYTSEQHIAWALGFLASIVMEKNHMDNIIWAHLKERLYD